MIEIWNETLPDDNGLAGDGDDEIVSLKARVKERMELDHHFSGELDPLEGDCDGYHKKITLKALDDDPTPLTGTGVIYTKEVDGIIELFFMDEATGVVNQLTEQGVLSLNTLANDLDINNKSFMNIPTKEFSDTDGLVLSKNTAGTVYIEIKRPCSLKIKTINSGLSTGSSIIVVNPCIIKLIFTTGGSSPNLSTLLQPKQYICDSSFSEIGMILFDSAIIISTGNPRPPIKIIVYKVPFYNGDDVSDIAEVVTP